IQPKCRPRVPTALPIALKANRQASVRTIQCRATSEAIDGVAIRSTPPTIQATVGICQTKRNSGRRRRGSMVTRGKIFVSDSTPWISAAAIATTPEACSRTSRMRGLNTVLYGSRLATGACQYSTVWLQAMTDQLSAQDWLDQGLKT